MHQHKKLKVWQKSIDLATEVYRITHELPKEEKFGLVSQARRSVVSICSNIAEGAGRNTNGEFNQFLGFANGSAFELDTQLIISRNLDFIKNTEFEVLERQIEEVQKMLYNLKKSIQKRQ